MRFLYYPALGRAGLLLASLFLFVGNASTQVCDNTACGFLVCSGADLAPRYTWIAGSGVAGEPISIGGRARNCGQAQSPNTVMRWWFSDDQILDINDLLLYEVNVPPVAANCGLSTVYRDTPTLPCVTPGRYYLIVEVDADDDIGGCDDNFGYGNNLAIKPTDIRSPLPDLALINPSPTLPGGPTYCYGSTFRATVVATNLQGCATDAEVELYLSDTPNGGGEVDIFLASQNVGPLAEGEAISVGFDAVVPSGIPTFQDYYLIFRIQSDDHPIDANPLNDTALGSIFVETNCQTGGQNGDGNGNELGANPTGKVGFSSEVLFNVSPNPAVDFIQVSYTPRETPVRLTVHNLNGQLLRDQTLTASEQTGGANIDLAGLQSGLYFVRYTSANDEFIRKVFKR